MKKYLLFIFICIQFICYGSENSTTKSRILIGSTIQQKHAILKEFLGSLKHLDTQNSTLDYFFIDDNNIEDSSHLLKDFSNVESNCLILSSKNDIKYLIDDWEKKLIEKNAVFKDIMIQKAIIENYDYLFLIDTDLALHPKTINQLIEAKKDIISNIFWTKQNPDSKLLPQVGFYESSKLYRQEFMEQLTQEEISKRTTDFLSMLHNPGTYEVGTLGKCTLISKKALNKGVSFKKISNLTMKEEDYHFSLRAVVLGLSLFVDTHYPAFNINTEADLAKLEDLKKKYDIKKPRLTLSMVIRNEADCYLRKVLEKAKEYITDAVIIDDASTDNSTEICLDVLKGIPLHLVVNSKSKFANEIELRKQQWEETIKTNPEWILVLDADQIFEDKFKDEIKDLISSNDIDAYLFQQYDFWSETHYRDDQYWQAHHYYYPFLIRYNPNIEYQWKEQAQHCGHFPQTINQFKKKYASLRLKHFGWAKYENRIAKYQRYKQLDPDAKYGWKEQYESILDDNPKLTKWVETISAS